MSAMIHKQCPNCGYEVEMQPVADLLPKAGEERRTTGEQTDGSFSNGFPRVGSERRRRIGGLLGEAGATGCWVSDNSPIAVELLFCSPEHAQGFIQSVLAESIIEDTYSRDTTPELPQTILNSYANEVHEDGEKGKDETGNQDTSGEQAPESGNEPGGNPG